MNKEETEKVVKETIEYANTEIKKCKRRYIKSFFIIFGIILLLILTYLVVFKYEIPLKYSKELMFHQCLQDISYVKTYHLLPHYIYEVTF